MRCLYCGKELALLKRLKGEEFCSDAHRQRYNEEYTELALSRLMQAGSQEPQPGGPPSLGGNPLGAATSAPELFENLKIEEYATAGTSQPEHLARSIESTNAPGSGGYPLPKQLEAKGQTAVLERPSSALTAEATLAQEDPAPAEMSSYLMESPMPAEPAVVTVADSTTDLALTSGRTLPRLEAFAGAVTDCRFDLAERIRLAVPSPATFQSPPRQRGLELREFVRGLPTAKIQLRPAGKTGFESAPKGSNVSFDGRAPDGAPRIWQFPDKELPPLGLQNEILLGELAHLDLAVTDWKTEIGPAAIEEPPIKIEEPIITADAASAEPIPVANEWARFEPMRVKAIQFDSGPREQPRPLQFEPVHIDPRFMEQIAGASLAESAVLVPAAEPEIVNEEVVEEVFEEEPVTELPAGPEPLAPSEPELPPQAISKPATVTLHGLAPARGKPAQVFASAVFRSGVVEIPRENCLPLRPTMVLGPALKPANTAAPEIPQSKAPLSKVNPPQSGQVPIVEKRERPLVARPNKPDVRPIPVGNKEVEPVQPELSKPELASKAPVSPATHAASPQKTSLQPQIETAIPSPAEEQTLPGLSYGSSESFWGRLPIAVRFGGIAAVLALVIGGVVLTSHGTSAPAAPPPAPREPQVVEASSALANTGGWAQDWFTDHGGSKQGRHVDVLRGTLTLRDYRLVFEGQIEQGALGWVFRANNRSFYVEKVQVVTPGLQPIVALVRFAVINGEEGPRTQIPLSIKAHLDTTYKVRMDAVGNRFSTWIQDQKVDEWTDGQIDAGGVGLYYDTGDSAKLRDTLNVIPLKLK